jgi:hypothetical protein
MRRCPLCRAELGEADTCRRCRADLGAVKALERTSQALAAAASHRLAEGEIAAARVLARRAMVLHASPENRALLELLRHIRLHPKEAAVLF